MHSLLTLLASLALISLTFSISALLWGLMTKRWLLTRRWGLVAWVSLAVFILTFLSWRR